MRQARRYLSLWLALLLCLSVLAPAALAQEEPVGETEPIEAAESAEEPDPAEAPAEAVPEEEPAEAPAPEEEPAPEAEPTEAPVEDVDAPPAEEAAPAEDELTELTTETVESELQTVVFPGGEDNDTLFAGYVEDAFGYEAAGGDELWGPVLDGAKRDIGGTLTGTTKTMYDILCPQIEAVAAGTLTSTVFYVPFEELFGGKTSWTAEELGVDAIVSNGAITQEAQQAFADKVAFDSASVIFALMADHPYEMYWYDKTHGALTSWSMRFNATGRGSSYTLQPGGGYTLKFSVAAAYAAGEYETNGAGSTVTAAVARAQQIVADNAGLSDYEKLVAYKNEICALTAYNHDAADPVMRVDYGDPWQLIWVFDGDPDTTVVCEGYSKAFCYLCDQSTFTAGITCICATGSMNGGGHMWNVVTMDDGGRYLVDVTNCDENTVGYPDLLFLRGYASGNAAAGYTFRCHSWDIKYVYDGDSSSRYMSRLYPEEDLVLSADDYAGLNSFSQSASARGVALTGRGALDAGDLAGVDGETVVTLDHRVSDVTAAAASVLSTARAVLIRPVDPEEELDVLLETLDSAGVNARVMGDADADGVIMVDDMILLILACEEGEELDELSRLALDVNGDGHTDIEDAEQMAAFLVGHSPIVG